MANPWDNDPIIKSGGPIMGPPPKLPPYAAEDQQLQRNAEARAAEDQEFQRQKFTVEMEERRKDREAGVGKDGAARESEAKAAAFLIRALGSNDSYEAIDIDKQTGGVQPIGPRSLVGQQMADRVPNVLNSLPGWIGNSSERQVSDSNQDEFIAASLRQDSGAAIPPEELDRQRRIYFPMPGDGPEAIAAKRMARLRAIEGLLQSAGRLAEPTMARYRSMGEKSLGEDGGLQTTITDESGAPPAATPPPPPDDGSPDGRDPSGFSGLGALAKQGVTLGLSDEAAGIGGYLSSFFTGEDPTAAYQRERDTERRFVSQAREEWPILGTGAEILGGGGAARFAAGPVSLASIARQGAGLGSVGGFGYGEGSESVPNAGLGAVGGAALGAGLYGAGRGLSSLLTARRGPTPDAGLVAAGERQGIPIRQPDARPEMRNQMAQVETTQTGGPIIREARAADQTAIENRVSEIGGPGNASDPYALGTKVQEAGSRYIARTKGQANRLYQKAEQEAGNATVQPTEAIAAVDQHIAELRAAGENSNSGQISYLEGLKADLSKPLSIQSVQNLRTNMRGQLSERGLTNTDAERRVGQIIDAANMDLTRELPQGASTALRAADDFYRQRQEFINGTLKQFMGSKGAPLSAETAASRLVSMTQGKGNYDRFARMWKELDHSEQADIAATVASSLGRRANGEFSAATLIRSLDPSKGINPRTAKLLFGDDGAKALDDLRQIAVAKSDTGQAMNNSRTGVVVSQTMGNLKTMLMAAFGFAGGGVGGAAAGAVSREFLSRWGEQRAARMLLNPDFTKWLRQAPNTTNARAIDIYFSRLAGMGSIAANDNQAFTNALMGAVRKSPGSAAAEQETDSRREPPKQ